VNVLFFGTPNIAVPYLDWLDEHHTVVGVVCQPDRPVGRGYEIQPPPTKAFAQQKRIPIFQPVGRWDESVIHQMQKTEADIGVAVAYGRILPEGVINAPRLGTLNVHFSLLPKYRGAAPMQWALVNGEKETGVSVFWLEKEMDSGPIFHQAAIPIESDDAKSLEDKLIRLGISVLSDTFRDLGQNKILKKPQTGAPTLAPLLKKENGRIDWTKSADSIVNLVRGLCEWPVAFTEAEIQGQKKHFKIHRASVSAETSKGSAGQILSSTEKGGLVVNTGAGAVSVEVLQAEGKKPMPAWAFWQGGHLKIGDFFS
jgi:methionyl-tRNA formyltransferase